MRPELVEGHPADFDRLSPHNTRRTCISTVLSLSKGAVLSLSKGSAPHGPPKALTTRLIS